MHKHHHYVTLLINVVLGLAVMYLAMFAMIASRNEFFNNINMFYMALMMAAPMGPIMILTMSSMYQHQAMNIAFHVAFAVIFLAAFFAIRQQAFVGDRQFLRSMIPHHSGAILMCREATLTNPELRTLCANIIRSQAEEIAQMKAILDRR
jgi:uncharacterized protein (DUF305 family)